MRRRILLCLALGLLSACRGDDATRPIVTDASSPANSISDGNHCAVPGFGCAKGNPDFFFLPPMAGNPVGSPNWTAGAFNGSLAPVVDICELKATTEQQVRDGAPCADAPAAYKVALTLGAADVHDEQYQVNWGVPTAPAIFYRIAVRVGGTTLGWSDVETAANASKLKNVTTGEFVPLVDGRTLPIKFRIEQYALCEIPGVGPCATKTIEAITALTEPVTVSTSLAPNAPPSGVTFGIAPAPAAPKTASARTAATAATATSEPHTVTVSSCTGFRERDITDLPTFGPCVRIAIDPALTEPLPTPAVVFSCEVSDKTVVSGLVDGAQAERIALHQLTGAGADQKLQALPHEHPDCPPSSYSATGTLHGVFASLAHGQLRAAAKQMAALVSPKPLYAARRFIDLGGGGGTHFLDDLALSGMAARAPGAAVGSGARTQAAAAATAGVYSSGDFQFALPAKFQVDATPDVAGTPGSLFNVQVKVTDLGGAPVRNARVRFAADQGGTVDNAVVDHTGADGLASVAWTIGSAQGIYHLTASGRGIAGTNVNGPRGGSEVVDPFQPLQTHWGDGSDSDSPALVGNGSMVVSATTLGSISGSVVEDVDGTAVAGATVTVGSATATTAADGTFSIPGVAGGTYSVMATAATFVAATREGIVIAAGANTALEAIRLVLQTGSIAGTVVNAFDHSPIAGATVSTGSSSATTSGDGSFQIGGVVPGTYDVTATATNYVSATTTGVVVTGGNATSAGALNLAPVATGSDIRVVLDWDGCSSSSPPGTGPCDLDSHLTGPDTSGTRFHVFFGDPTFSDAASAATLDIDQTNGRGPETITLSRQLAGGVYHYYVHNYSVFSNYNDPVPFPQSGARVRVFSGATLLATYDVPTTESGEVWDVFSLNGTTITPINHLANFDPFNPAARRPGVAAAAGAASSQNDLKRIADDLARTPKRPR
jgi:hypothetical protein